MLMPVSYDADIISTAWLQNGFISNFFRIVIISFEQVFDVKIVSQLTFTCLKSTMETLEQRVKFVQN